MQTLSNTAITKAAWRWTQEEELTCAPIVVPDLHEVNNVYVVIDQDMVFDIPINFHQNQSGLIYFIQDEFGGHTVEMNNNYKLLDNVTFTTQAETYTVLRYIIFQGSLVQINYVGEGSFNKSFFAEFETNAAATVTAIGVAPDDSKYEVSDDNGLTWKNQNGTYNIPGAGNYQMRKTNGPLNVKFGDGLSTGNAFVGHMRVDSIGATSAEEMFAYNDFITIDITGSRFQQVTTMHRMFKFTSLFNTIDLSTFSTRSCTTFAHMFDSAYQLDAVDVSTFDTSKATDMSSMFYDISLKTFDGTGWDTSNVTNFNRMFQNNFLTDCKMNWDTSSGSDFGYMFSGNGTMTCISDLDTTASIDGSGIFSGCGALTSPDAATQANLEATPGIDWTGPACP